MTTWNVFVSLICSIWAESLASLLFLAVTWWSVAREVFTAFCRFVEAVSILLGDNISREDLAVAEYFLDTFYKKFADLYGISFCHPSFIPRNHHLDLTCCLDPGGGRGTGQVRLASHSVHSNCGTQSKEFCSASQTLLTGVRLCLQYRLHHMWKRKRNCHSSFNL